MIPSVSDDCVEDSLVVDSNNDGVVMLSPNVVFFNDAEYRTDGKKIYHVFEYVQSDEICTAESQRQISEFQKAALIAKASKENFENVEKILGENGIPLDEWCPAITPETFSEKHSSSILRGFSHEENSTICTEVCEDDDAISEGKVLQISSEKTFQEHLVKQEEQLVKQEEHLVKQEEQLVKQEEHLVKHKQPLVDEGLSGYPFTCDNCNSKTSSSDSFNSEDLYLSELKTQGRIRCSECHFLNDVGQPHLAEGNDAYSTDIKSNLKDYELTFQDSKMHRCSNCSFATRSKSNLNRHQVFYHDSETFSCSEYDFSTRQQKSFSEHQLSHHTKAENPKSAHVRRNKAKCTIQNRRSSSSRNNKSCGTEVNNTKKLVCRKCNYATDNKSNFSKHQSSTRHILNSGPNSHKVIRKNPTEGRDENSYSCPECGFIIKDYSNLKSEDLISHEYLIQYQCHYCPFITNLKKNLKRHFLVSHKEKLEKVNSANYEIEDFCTSSRKSSLKHVKNPLVDTRRVWINCKESKGSGTRYFMISRVETKDPPDRVSDEGKTELRTKEVEVKGENSSETTVGKVTSNFSKNKSIRLPKLCVSQQLIGGIPLLNLKVVIEDIFKNVEKEDISDNGNYDLPNDDKLFKEVKIKIERCDIKNQDDLDERIVRPVSRTTRASVRRSRSCDLKVDTEKNINLDSIKVPIKDENIEDKVEVKKELVEDSAPDEDQSLQEQDEGKEVLNCKFCMFRSIYSYSMQRHLDKYCKLKYKCTKCPYIAKNSKLLQSHISSHKAKHKFVCENCHFIANSASGLKIHAKEHVGKENCSCKSCPYVAKSSKMLKIHVNHIHKSDRKYTCKEYSHVSTSLPSLRSHAQKHQKIYNCHLCDYVSNSLSLKEDHMKIHSILKTEIKTEGDGKTPVGGNRDEVFAWKDCSDVAQKTQRLKTQLNQSRKPISKYKCQKCSYVTTNLKLFKAHSKEHGGILYKCDVCDYCTNNLKRKDNHMKIHSSQRVVKRNYRTFVKSRLTVKLAKRDKERYECDKCDYSCETIHSLNLHALTHFSNKILKCEHCSYKTNFKGNLVKHVLIHLENEYIIN